MRFVNRVAIFAFALSALLLLTSCDQGTQPPQDGTEQMGNSGAVDTSDSGTAEENLLYGMETVYYNSVRDMKEATDVKAGTIVITRGYKLSSDMGGAAYTVRERYEDDTEDGMEKHFLQNNLVAVFAEENQVRPEMFGAGGDGRADDTDEMKLTLKYMEKGYSFVGTGKYGISEPLTPAKVVGVPYYYDFNSSTLVALKEMDSMIYFARESDNGYVPSYIKSIRLDCNSKAERGIHIVWIRSLFLEDFFILNPVKYGIEVEKGALYTDNGVFNVLDYSLKPTGIYMHEASTDSKIYNIRMRDYPVAIRADGAANFFHNVHAWLINQPIGYSVFMEYKGSQHVNQCYSDTYHISFKSTGAGTLTLVDCQFFPNTDFYKQSDPSPIIFTTDTKYRTSGRIFMSNCYFQFDGYFNKYGKQGIFIANNGDDLNTMNWIDLLENNQLNTKYFKNLPAWLDGTDKKITPISGTAVSQNFVKVHGENATVQYEVKMSGKLTDKETVIGILSDVQILPMGAAYPNNYLTIPCTLSDSATGKVGTGAVRFYYNSGSTVGKNITVIGGEGFDTVTVSTQIPLNWVKDNP